MMCIWSLFYLHLRFTCSSDLVGTVEKLISLLFEQNNKPVSLLRSIISMTKNNGLSVAFNVVALCTFLAVWYRVVSVCPFSC